MPSSDARIGAFRRRLREERGQVLPMTALMMVVLVGFAALVVDVGRVYLAQRQLQNAVDSTALAIAQNMPDDYAGWCQSAGSTASIDCASLTPAPPPLGYSGITGGKNALLGYGVTAGAPIVTFACSQSGPGYKGGQCPQDGSSQDTTTPCQPGTSATPQPAGVGCNAVSVSESATLKTTLAGIFGFSNFNLTATGTATAPDQTITPIDAAVVVDTTGSMGDRTPNGVCPGISTPDKLDCAKAGVQTLLQTLYPCTPGSACGGNNQPLDKVELLIFPGLTSTNLRAREEDCTQNLQNPLGNFKEYDDDQNKTVNPFTNEGYTYTVVPWESSFASWSTAQNKFVLNANDPFVRAVQTGPCGLEPGGSTSFSSALQAAQDSFSTLGNDGATHAIIFLGDGEANYGPIYTSPNEPPASPDRRTPCQQAVNVAQQATAAGTAVYSIGYWENNSTDEEQLCLGMINQNGCRYGMTTAHMTQQFGNTCYEPNVSGAAPPPGCPAVPRGDPDPADPIRGCWTMYNLASNPGDFYPDASDTSLNAIFKQIGQNLGKTRLIP